MTKKAKGSATQAGAPEDASRNQGEAHEVLGRPLGPAKLGPKPRDELAVGKGLIHGEKLSSHCDEKLISHCDNVFDSSASARSGRQINP